jgi:uncharacterized protein
MKKRILFLGLAFTAITNVSFASNSLIVSNNREVVFFEPTPLCNAIVKGDLETAKKFIDYGVDVNEISEGVTPLMLAARYNRVDIIDLLLAKGAKLDMRDDNGFSALEYAENSKAANAFIRLKKELKKT